MPIQEKVKEYIESTDPSHKYGILTWLSDLIHPGVKSKISREETEAAIEGMINIFNYENEVRNPINPAIPLLTTILVSGAEEVQGHKGGIINSLKEAFDNVHPRVKSRIFRNLLTAWEYRGRMSPEISKSLDGTLKGMFDNTIKKEDADSNLVAEVIRGHDVKGKEAFEDIEKVFDRQKGLEKPNPDLVSAVADAYVKFARGEDEKIGGRAAEAIKGGVIDPNPVINTVFTSAAKQVEDIIGKAELEKLILEKPSLGEVKKWTPPEGYETPEGFLKHLAEDILDAPLRLYEDRVVRDEDEEIRLGAARDELVKLIKTKLANNEALHFDDVLDTLNLRDEKGEFKLNNIIRSFLPGLHIDFIRHLPPEELPTLNEFVHTSGPMAKEEYKEKCLNSLKRYHWLMEREGDFKDKIPLIKSIEIQGAAAVNKLKETEYPGEHFGAQLKEVYDKLKGKIDSKKMENIIGVLIHEAHVDQRAHQFRLRHSSRHVVEGDYLHEEYPGRIRDIAWDALGYDSKEIEELLAGTWASRENRLNDIGTRLRDPLGNREHYFDENKLETGRKKLEEIKKR